MNTKASGQEANTALGPTMKKHLANLGLKTFSRYESWCETHGFSKGFKKTWAQLEMEVSYYQNHQKTQQQRSRVYQNPTQFLREAALGTFPIERIPHGPWRNVTLAVNQASLKSWERLTLANMLVYLHKCSKFLFESRTVGIHGIPYMDALIQLFKIRSIWKRPYQTWTPGSHNLHAQFESLANHLLIDYPVPLFLYSVWFRNDPPAACFQNWFLSLGRGRSLRNQFSPVPFTKKSAHLFLSAPSDLSIEQALVWSRVLALGGDPHLAGAILGSKMGDRLEHWDFWGTVWHFFIRNPMFDRAQVSPIVDFLLFQKFETQERLIGPGVIQRVPPPHPQLTMKGRTPEALLHQMNVWHGELTRNRDIANMFFRKSDIKPYSQKFGIKKQHSEKIQQLLSGEALIEEGKRMHHCVSTYAKGCQLGECSIWSLFQTQENLPQKHLLTIEVNKSKVIVQARGKWNRHPSCQEFTTLEKWARASDLKIAPYVHHA